MKSLGSLLLLCCIALAASSAVWCDQKVIIIVLDGVRYSESLGAKERYMPHIWNELRQEGTIYTNFRNEGLTLTCPGHASVLTGIWQKIANDGLEEFPNPTIFEFFRKQTGSPESSCAVVSGKSKLHILTHSADTAYGAKYQAAFLANESGKNTDTWNNLFAVMKASHPHAVIVNCAETDLLGHAKNWDGYLGAIKEVDSLIWELWRNIQSDSIYKDSTTLFVTNDHGRHDDAHGGFKNHGDSCEGCRHIMLLALGPQFRHGAEVAEASYQIDVAPTAAEILDIEFPPVPGRNLLHDQSGRMKH